MVCASISLNENWWWLALEISAYLYLHKCTYKACAFHPSLILFHGLILGLSHYIDVIMITMASQITSLTIVYSTVCSGADIKQHQGSALLAVVREIHRWPANSLHKGQITRKMFLFDDVIMKIAWRFWTHTCVTKETKPFFKTYISYITRDEIILYSFYILKSLFYVLRVWDYQVL